MGRKIRVHGKSCPKDNMFLPYWKQETTIAHSCHDHNSTTIHGNPKQGQRKLEGHVNYY